VIKDDLAAYQLYCQLCCGLHMLTVHERYFESLTLNDKLAAWWHPTSCSRPEWDRGCWI